MEFTPPLATGRLIKRYKRFLADVELPDGSVLTVHCPNTGSMKNCGGPGSRVWYSSSPNPKRKYPHTLEQVEVADGAVAGINTARANALVREALEAGCIPELAGYRRLRPEVRYGEEASRVDFLLEDHPGDSRRCLVEVKSVTLGLGSGVGAFPDAVTDRGTRHLRELIHMRGQGCRAVLFFCVQHTGVEVVRPAWEIDPHYAATLAEAVAAGVEVLAYKARITPEEIALTGAAAVDLRRQ